jgi:hypothetical protein
MIHAHQPGSQPIDIPEVIPNPAVVPKQEPGPKEPAPKNPVKVPEKVPVDYATGVQFAQLIDGSGDDLCRPRLAFGRRRSDGPRVA